MKNNRKRRSWLLTLTVDDKKVQRAAESNADVLILDLTDSVVPELKNEARRRVVDWLSGSSPFGDKQIAVKINNLWSEWGREDLEAISFLNFDILYYPEVKAAEEIRVVAEALNAAGSPAEIAVLLETPQSFVEIQALATAPRVCAFNHAQGDLSVNLGVSLSDTRDTLLYTASKLVLYARAYGLLAIDTALPSNLKDPDLSKKYFESSKRLGFDASSTFYAPHVDGINSVFSPTSHELTEAREIVDEYTAVMREGRAAYVRPNGRWVTVHQFRQAQNLLAQFG